MKARVRWERMEASGLRSAHTGPEVCTRREAWAPLNRRLGREEEMVHPRHGPARTNLSEKEWMKRIVVACKVSRPGLERLASGISRE